MVDDGLQAAVQGCDVTDDRGGGKFVAQLRGRGLDPLRVLGVGAQARFQQLDFRREVVVLRTEVAQALLRGTRLPVADGTLALRGLDVDSAIVCDSAPLARVVCGDVAYRHRCAGRRGFGSHCAGLRHSWLRTPGLRSPRLRRLVGLVVGVGRRGHGENHPSTLCRATRLPRTQCSCAFVCPHTVPRTARYRARNRGNELRG